MNRLFGVQAIAHAGEHGGQLYRCRKGFLPIRIDFDRAVRFISQHHDRAGEIELRLDEPSPPPRRVIR